MYAFDDRHVKWQPLGEFEHFVATVFDIDEEREIVDFMIKFDADRQIVLHRHLSLTQTFVVQGEHVIYEPDGRVKEVRAVGTYTSAPPGPPHREGGGPDGAVVFYSVRGAQGRYFELLDDAQNVIATLTIADFKQLQQAG